MSTLIDKINNKQRSPFHLFVGLTREKDNVGVFQRLSRCSVGVNTQKLMVKVCSFLLQCSGTSTCLDPSHCFYFVIEKQQQKKKENKKNNSSCKGFAERGTSSLFLTQANSSNWPAAVDLKIVSFWFQPGPLANKATYMWNAKMFSPSFPVLSSPQASLKPLDSVKSRQTSWIHKESVISLTFILSKGCKHNHISQKLLQ